MNKENLDFLADNIKYAGFGELLKDDLQKNMAEGKPEFHLHFTTELNKAKMEATLNFRKSDSTSRYFFNNWEGVLKNDVGRTAQTFYMHKGQGITLKEGYNLLEGRAVHKELTDKEGKKYDAWLQLNKKEQDTAGNYKVAQYHQNYGYNLEAALTKHPIKELGDPAQKEALLKSLERGNLQSVTFEKKGFAEKLFVEANPQFKTINAYDHSGTRIGVQELTKRFDFAQNEGKKNDVEVLGGVKGVVPGKEPSEKAIGKKETMNGDADTVKKKAGKSRTQGTDGDLLPKKRARGQKNLGMA